MEDRQPTSNRKRNLSWVSYLRLINRLARKIDWKKEEFDAIVSINRGGNIIGTILSHKTRLQLHVIEKGQAVNFGGKILLVDDISDTGSTFLTVISNLKSGTDYKTASLHIKSDTKHKPNYFVSTVNYWVVYPYERLKRRETK